MSVFAYSFSGSNTYVPSLESSGNIIVNFSRNQSSFKLNRYIGIRKVDKDTGFWTQMKNEEQARIVNVQDYIWPAGNDEPMGNVNANPHTFNQYVCTRYAYPFAIDWKAVQQAAWPVVSQYASIEAAKAMTNRTIRVHNVLSASGNWAGSTATATSLGGGLWSAATTANLYIKKSLLSAVQKINVATNGVVQPRDMVLIVNPKLAVAMAETDEVHGYLKGSPFSMGVLKGENEIGEWGLPSRLYGIPVIIEDAVQVTSRKGATRADGYVQGDANAYLLARPEGLNSGIGSGPTYNTFTMFCYEEFTVETKDDIDNRRTKGRVVEDTAEVLTAPAAGYFISSCQ